MKILAGPDLHCWWPNYSKNGEGGVPSRLTDFRHTAAALVETATKHKVSAALFPGDLFPTSRPAPAQILEVAELFSFMEGSGSSAIACAGNHDLLGPGQLSPVDLVACMGPSDRRWGRTEPGIVHLNDLDIIVLPSVKAAKTQADPAVAAQETSLQLVSILRALVAQSKAPYKVIMGHWAISGCRLAAGNMLAASEPTLPLGEVQSLPVQAVVMGHIHIPQVIATNPLVLHTGVLERNNFGEETVPCGCYVIDLDTQQAEFVELPARRFKTCEIQPDELPRLIDNPDEIAAFTGIEDAIVRVTYKATEEKAKQLDHGAMIKALYDAGAHQVSGVYPEVIRSERTREASISETTGPIEALGKWLNLRDDISDSLKAGVITAAQGLLREVA
jgi:DNA repair exonuclease SbcCD nuclease subunit